MWLLRRSTWGRLLILVAALYIVGTVLGGIILGWIALHPPRNVITQSEENNVDADAKANGDEFRSVSLTTSDGTILRAWFIRPREANGSAVIPLHGVGDNRLGMYGYGKWL